MAAGILPSTPDRLGSSMNSALRANLNPHKDLGVPLTDNTQQQIASGQPLRPGDKVKLVTTDGKVHEFASTANDAVEGTAKGPADSVRVDDIVTVEKREPALGKTIGLVLGIVGGLQLGAAIGDFSPPWAAQ